MDSGVNKPGRLVVRREHDTADDSGQPSPEVHGPVRKPNWIHWLGRGSVIASRAGSVVWRGRTLAWSGVAGTDVDRARPAPLPIPFERVGDGLPFVEVVEAYPLNGGCVEEQRDAAYGRPSEPWRELLPIAPLMEWQEQ
jgi:hypothetical protein